MQGSPPSGQRLLCSGFVVSNVDATVLKATTFVLIPESRLREGLLTGDVFVARSASNLGV